MLCHLSSSFCPSHRCLATDLGRRPFGTRRSCVLQSLVLLTLVVRLSACQVACGCLPSDLILQLKQNFDHSDSKISIIFELIEWAAKDLSSCATTRSIAPNW